MNDKIAFDPGISKLLTDFNNYVNEVYSQLMSFSSISQKRTRFKIYNDKIYQGMQNNIAFYNGCLLWAYYVKKQNKPLVLDGNPFLNFSQKEIDEYDFLMQINFMENYFDSYERDTQYYMGKKIEIPQKWKEILELYKQFLELNKGFVSTKTSSDLLLPEKLMKKNIKEDIKKLIDCAIEKSDAKILLQIDI